MHLKKYATLLHLHIFHVWINSPFSFVLDYIWKVWFVHILRLNTETDVNENPIKGQTSVFIGSLRIWRKYIWIGHPVQTHKNQFFARPKGLWQIRAPYKKLSSGRNHCRGAIFHIFFYGDLFLKTDENAPTFVAPHSWMHLVKSSTTEVSVVSEVLQSRVKLIFRKPGCCVSTHKLISIDANRNTKYKRKLVQTNNF